SERRRSGTRTDRRAARVRREVARSRRTQPANSSPSSALAQPGYVTPGKIPETRRECVPTVVLAVPFSHESASHRRIRGKLVVVSGDAVALFIGRNVDEKTAVFRAAGRSDLVRVRGACLRTGRRRVAHDLRRGGRAARRGAHARRGGSADERGHRTDAPVLAP